MLVAMRGCMQTFLDIIFSFPTLVFTVALLVASGYWLLTLLGLFDLNVLDFGDAGGDIGGEVGGDGVDGGDTGGELGGFAAVLLKFGLDGLPLALIFTAVSLIGWVLSYLAEVLILRPLGWGAMLHLATGAGLIVVAILIALPIAGLILQPIKPLFRSQPAPDANAFLGREVVVRSPKVDLENGEADFDDGGAGLIFKIRASPKLNLKRGDKVVLVEYLPEQNAYRVIAV